ncbi:MAG: hypothetical protein R3D66_01950 [Alphaproteobacteria bacterium]
MALFFWLPARAALGGDDGLGEATLGGDGCLGRLRLAGVAVWGGCAW